MYFFAMKFDGDIALSDEHKDVRWRTYDDEKLIFWHDQKTALWELNERLRRKNLVR